MKHKEQKALCVYAGPEIMARMHGSPVKSPKADGLTVCPNCGRKADANDRYCSDCGTPLPTSEAVKDLTPPPFSSPPPAPVATYAGPDFYQNGVGIGSPISPPEKPPYPQNFVSEDEEPLDVYAGPPIDCDE